MSGVLKPESEQELAEIVAASAEPLEIVGTGTKRGLGRPMQTARTLDMSGFSALAVYEPEELIIEAGAGARLADIEAMIDARGQQLAFEPPDLSAVLGTAHSGTLGGLVACNLAGPRRIKAGAARDHVMGVRGVTGTGDIFKAGARVVKNVTGYDLPKLVTGSYGTLAAVTSIILKVLPKPATEETLVIEVATDAEAVRLMSLAMQSACEVSAAAYVPGDGVFLRLEGIAPSVAYRRDRLASALGCTVKVLAARSSAARWKSIRDAGMFAGDRSRPLWRVSVTPSDAPQVLARLKNRTEFRHMLDWAGGLLWIEVPPSDDASAVLIRNAIDSGHATLVRAPDAVRSAVDVFQPQDPALAALSARVKASFDPQRILNPGRMYRMH